MPKRILIILSSLLVAFLAYFQSTYVVGAQESPEKQFRTGNTVEECIFLAEGLYIKVIRSPSDLCAATVEHHRNKTCTDKVADIPISGKRPKTAAYGIGNLACKESIVIYPKSNPGLCFEYHSGCRTRYIPRGCENW